MHTCWPTSRVGRSISGSFTNFTSLALQPLAFRQLSIESGFIIWPTEVNRTLSLRAVPFSASSHTHSIGDRRTETCGRKNKKKKHRWHCICFQKATSFPCFVMIGNGRVHRPLGVTRKVKIFRRKSPLHRTVLSLTPEFAPSSRQRAANQCFLSSLDSGKLWQDSEGLVLRPLEKRGTQQWSMVGFPKSKKRCQIKPETHTSQSFLAGDAPYLVPGQSLEKSSIVTTMERPRFTNKPTEKNSIHTKTILSNMRY